MKSKRLDICRTVIFTVLACGMAFLIWKILPDFTMRNTLLYMLTPLFAHVLTRLITRDKAGTKELLLHFYAKGKLKYYIMTFAYPIIASLISSFLIVAVYADNYSLSEQLSGGKLKDMILMLFFAIGNSALVFYICLGEEYGWRAYLTPKLESLMPEPLALIASGCIWGFWHAPLIKDIGLNFGTGYKFFPYAGYIAMCVFCIFTGAFLTWLTRKTESVYPSAICHTFIDTITIVNYLVPEELLEKSTEAGQFAFDFGCLFMSGLAVVGAVFFVILCIECRKKKSA